MRIKIWQLIVVILLLVNTVVLALLWLAKKEDKLPPPPGRSAKEFLIKELSLSEQQIEQYNNLREQHFNQIQEINKATRELRDRLFDNISTGRADSAVIQDLATQISRKETEKEIVTLYHFRNVRSLLTEEQKQKFDKVIKDVLRMMARPPSPGRRNRPEGARPEEHERPGERPEGDGAEKLRPRRSEH